METNDAALRKVARLRDCVPINRGSSVPAVKILSSYVLPGVDWDYYQAFYRNLGLNENWPAGMSAHASWEGRDGWRTVYLWDENSNADRYFGSVGIEAVTDTVRELGPAKSPEGATDVVPLRLDVHEWMLGFYAGAFSDLDEKAGGGADRLGLQPVVVEMDLAADPAAVVKALGVDKRIPRDLIAALVSDHPVGSRMLQFWTDDEVARTALETVIFPAFEKAGIECDADPAESISELRRLVVADGAAASFGHPPAIEL